MSERASTIRAFAGVADWARILGLVTEAFRLLREAQPVAGKEKSLQSPKLLTTESLGNDVAPSTEDDKGEANDELVNKQPTAKVDEKCEDPLDAIAPATNTSGTPYPIVTSSVIELVGLLKDWIMRHPSLRIPELAKYDRNSLEDNFAIEASLIETGERVWILRLGVIDLYLGWVLEKPDGSKLLVKAQYRKGGSVYYPWLGGDVGYSDEVIASHQDVPRQLLSLRAYARKQNLDAEDVLNDYDISREALEPQSPSPDPIIMGTQVSDSPLSSPLSSDSDLPLMSLRASRKRASEKEKSSNSKKAKLSAPTPSPKNHQAMRDLQNIDDADVRNKVKKLHKIFPKITVAVCECVLLKNKGIVDNAIDDLYGLQNVPTSTDTTVYDDGPPAASTRSRHAKTTGRSKVPRTPSPVPTKNSSNFQLATPHSNDDSPTSFGYPTPKTPSLQAGPNPVTTVSFFLANSAMGAVPIPFASIKSKNKFFNEAIAAHFLCSQSISDADNESIVAVSVAVSGLNHPIVVRRQDGGAAWNEVGRVVKEMEKMGTGVEVEVKCVVLPVGKRHKIAPRGY
ncbi:MAG: hypothetical protein Q9204_004325 [Flavoplaca sp. TL-2023a]